MNCHNCGSSKIMLEYTSEDKIQYKYFCCICGSDYMMYENYIKDNSLTEIKSFNIGVKIWKQKKSKEIKMSFIANQDSLKLFVDFCHKGIVNFELEKAEYIIKTDNGLYMRYNIITDTKSFLKP